MAYSNLRSLLKTIRFLIDSNEIYLSAVVGLQYLINHLHFYTSSKVGLRNGFLTSIFLINDLADIETYFHSGPLKVTYSFRILFNRL